MNQIANQFTPMNPITIKYPVQDTKAQNVSGSSFAEVLQQKRNSEESEGVTFSKHASQRLKNRNMQLSTEQMQRLNDGVDQARLKNIKDSLIVVDDMSFIVNVPNNMVVTALNGQDEQKIFTNIDGAVIS